MGKITLITGNKNKLKEIRSITGLKISAKNLDIPEIQALDVKKVAGEKALQAFKLTKAPVVVDDTAMSIESLEGLPGALICWFLNTIKTKGIIKLMEGRKNRKASVTTCIAYADKRGVFLFSGKIKGKISHSVRGKTGFGFDPIFIPEGYNKTYGEMTSKEKNQISMRKKALLKFKNFMQKKA